MSGKASAPGGYGTSGRALVDQLGETSRMLTRNAAGPMGEWSAQATPMMGELGRQINEALKTGGVGAQIPIINKAVEASRQASSNTMRSLDDTLGRTNLGGTPYGERLRSDTSLAGETAASRIPTDIASQFIAGALPYGTASPGGPLTAQSVQAGGVGGGITQQQIASSTNASVANKQATAQMVSALLGSAGQAGGQIGAAAIMAA